MKNVTGNPVEGEDFYGREQEQQEIWRKLESDHLLMLAPRRIGKTSLLKRLRDTGDENGFQVVLCSFAPCNDELDCIEQIIRALSANTKLRDQFFVPVKAYLSKVKGVTIAGFGIELTEVDRSRWPLIGEGLLQTLGQLDTPSIICVDEVPVFVLTLLKHTNGEERARSFLNWFRDLRQCHYRKVRWILAGSIGLDTVVSRLRLGDTINDLAPFPLGAFDEKSAHGLLQMLAKSYGLSLSHAVRQQIVSRIGWPVPYYLQLMFDRLLAQIGPRRKRIEIGAVDEAFEALLRPTYKVHFDYWRQRLKEELGTPDDGHAVHLLNIACHDPRGVSRDILSQALAERIIDPAARIEMLSYILDVLENDGYIVENSGRYCFRLAWLREYWRRRVAP